MGVWSCHSTVTNRQLPVVASTLNASQAFTFRCDVFTNPASSTAVGSAAISLQGSDAPWGGTVDVSPSSGDVTGGYEYTIRAQGWTAAVEDQPLTYSVQWQAAGTNQLKFLVGPTLSSTIRAVLPPGTILLTVSIANNRGQAAVITSGTTLSVPAAGGGPAISEQLWLQNVLEPALGTSNVARVLQVANAMSLLFGGSAQAALTGKAPVAVNGTVIDQSTHISSIGFLISALNRAAIMACSSQMRSVWLAQCPRDSIKGIVEHFTQAQPPPVSSGQW